MTRRTEQLASTLQRAVQEVMARGLSDPRARGMITITGCTVSPDLKHAEIMVSVYPEKHQDLTIHAIRDAARHIRRKAAERMALSVLPELNFRVDKSTKREAEVLDVLAKVAEENRAREKAAGGSDAAGREGDEPAWPSDHDVEDPKA
ncbi:MAG: 30S ribosome-binding factor RbfA [Phycisphaeraceae bacterium]|nr:30S ribosome-binding factor RbfA [Phycisphaeraceae bacterium]